LIGKKSPIENFILGVPKVLVRQKSFVGPEVINKNSELYLGKPGITGLWFIEKGQALDSNDFNKLDVYYAKNQNIWLDLEILGKSFSKMFFDIEK
jgi:lipopolysaccharide/colanic/teichoic acid biosynthesis glycosyltransferase